MTSVETVDGDVADAVEDATAEDEEWTAVDDDDDDGTATDAAAFARGETRTRCV